MEKTKSIKATRTERNLMASFAGECQAHMRYAYYAKAARKEGYEQIAAIFDETSSQEMMHAKRMFKWLEGGKVEITVPCLAGVISTTSDNLLEAAQGERSEWLDDYPLYAMQADEEGFTAIAAMYRRIAEAERGHEERFLALRRNLLDDCVFHKTEEVVWQCRKCGFLHVGTEAPYTCPSCLHPQAYFEVRKENY